MSEGPWVMLSWVISIHIHLKFEAFYRHICLFLTALLFYFYFGFFLMIYGSKKLSPLKTLHFYVNYNCCTLWLIAISVHFGSLQYILTHWCTLWLYRCSSLYILTHHCTLWLITVHFDLSLYTLTQSYTLWLIAVQFYSSLNTLAHWCTV